MSSALAKHDALLKSAGFKLIHQGRRNKVYRDASGRTYVTATTPSGYRWADNAFKTLKQVIANPPQPMTMAISEFGRKQASQSSSKARVTVLGGGKQHRTRGTSFHRTKGNGFIYEENIKTAEQQAREAEQRTQAEAAQLRKRGREQRRRADKLARKQEKETREQEREHREQAITDAVNQVVNDILPVAENLFEKVTNAVIASPAWYETFFYEFTIAPEEATIQRLAHEEFTVWMQSIQNTGTPTNTIDSRDRVMERLRSTILPAYLTASARQHRSDELTGIIRRTLRRHGVQDDEHAHLGTIIDAITRASEDQDIEEVYAVFSTVTDILKQLQSSKEGTE